jgi:ParB-like chromosome segregation protein Spo0J
LQHHSAVTAREPRVEITYRPIDELRPDPRNPRRHERKQIRKIADNIAAFGVNVPILIECRAPGHRRAWPALAFRLLGRNQVPTIGLEHLSPEARAFIIAKNRLTRDRRLERTGSSASSCANSPNSISISGWRSPASTDP